MKRKHKPPSKCIFCGGGNLSQTHIWPAWLKKLLDNSGTEFTFEQIKAIHLSRYDAEHEHTSRTGQGSIFSQKPRVACINCNTKWMRRFEDEMLKFAIPLFTGGEIVLNEYQIRVLAVWISLLTILGQYVDKERDSVTITADERQFVKRYLRPPPHWSIFAASQEVPNERGTWRRRYQLNTRRVQWNTAQESHVFKMLEGDAKNTQTASFGMGKLFVQTFVCPSHGIVSQYRIAARAAGLIPIWPMPRGFWPFTEGKAKFPTKLVLDNRAAEDMAHAFDDRMDILLKPKRPRGGR